MESSPSSPTPAGAAAFKPDDTANTVGHPFHKKCPHHRSTQIDSILNQLRQLRPQSRPWIQKPLQLDANAGPAVGTVQTQPHEPVTESCTRRAMFTSRTHPYMFRSTRGPFRGHTGLTANAPRNANPMMAFDRTSLLALPPRTARDGPIQPPAAPAVLSPNVAPSPAVVAAAVVAPVAAIPATPPTVAAVGVAAPSSSASSVSLDGPVLIQSQAGLVQPVNAALLSDRYLLMDPLKGSTLYKCIDMETHQDLVCKVANNPCCSLLTAHFRLDGHPNVNPLQKVIQGSHQTYMIFAPSHGDLHQHVRLNKRLRENDARRLFRQMCEVVKSSHEQGIVLRDLKLRKFVFADAEGQHLCLESLEDAVVLDKPDEDMLQDKRGCPAYVSPEILRHNATYSGKAADMWSLGVILYTMLVGRYPFNDSEHHTLFAKILRGQFSVPDCLSSKARCMIRSLLRREPSERICSEDLLLHPWMTHVEGSDSTRSSSPISGVSAVAPGLSAPSDQCVPDSYIPKVERVDFNLEKQFDWTF